MNDETRRRLERKRDHSSQMLGIVHRAQHAAEQVEDDEDGGSE